MRAYQHYGFQIHGEGHTHIPAQEEPNIGHEHLSSYINFGTWRDQVLPRKNTKYRRRSVLRALYILDLKKDSKSTKQASRILDYFVEDVVHWSDSKDALDQSGRAEPKTIRF